MDAGRNLNYAGSDTGGGGEERRGARRPRSVHGNVLLFGVKVQFAKQVEGVSVGSVFAEDFGSILFLEKGPGRRVPRGSRRAVQSTLHRHAEDVRDDESVVDPLGL